jgi:hypothetical protein
VGENNPSDNTAQQSNSWSTVQCLRDLGKHKKRTKTPEEVCMLYLYNAPLDDQERADDSRRPRPAAASTANRSERPRQAPRRACAQQRGRCRVAAATFALTAPSPPAAGRSTCCGWRRQVRHPGWSAGQETAVGLEKRTRSSDSMKVRHRQHTRWKKQNKRET